MIELLADPSIGVFSDASGRAQTCSVAAFLEDETYRGVNTFFYSTIEYLEGAGSLGVKVLR
jgi:hypothetical protein